MKIVNLEQGSEEWLKWRTTGIGASDAPAILGVSKYHTRRSLWEIKTGKREPDPENGAMRRGKHFEPIARAMYEDWMGLKMEPVCGSHELHDWMNASLDGYNEDKSLFVEIKAPNKEFHKLALAGQVPESYSPQVMHQFNVTAASLCHYVSYSDYFPHAQKFALVMCHRPDQKQLDRLLNIELEFLDCIRRDVPPSEHPE